MEQALKESWTAGGAMMRTGRKEEIMAKDEMLGSGLLAEDKAMPFEFPKLREKVDSIIDQWFTDMWLLLSGEELNASSLELPKDGHAFAMICGGQLHLLESRFSAMNRLRSVGLDMS